jgi:hypothetical protein
MVTMSQKEFQRVKVIENAAGGRLSVREAARLLQLSPRSQYTLPLRPIRHGLTQPAGNKGAQRPRSNKRHRVSGRARLGSVGLAITVPGESN